MKTKPNFIGLLLVPMILIGCKKLPDYPAEPQISINNIEVIRDIINPLTTGKSDSVTIKLNFNDGDGDLGNADNDTSFNYYLDLEKKENGIFEKLDFADGFTFNGRFPQLAPSASRSPIDGVLDYSFLIPHNFFVANNNVLRFQVYIQDRAGNKSNTVVTDTIIVKKL